MKKLLKQYGFTYESEYHLMCINSFINGQCTQAINQFNALSKQDRRDMVFIMVKEDFSKIHIRFFLNLL